MESNINRSNKHRHHILDSIAKLKATDEEERSNKESLLIHEYERFAAESGESITEIYDRLNRILNELRLVGKTYSNHDVNRKYIWALPDSWENRTIAIRENNDMHVMSLETLYEKLRIYELEDEQKKKLDEYHKKKNNKEAKSKKDNDYYKKKYYELKKKFEGLVIEGTCPDPDNSDEEVYVFSRA